MNKKILVVEDEKDLREAMADALTVAGYTVVAAENGERGLSEAFTHEPDLILLDLNMPVMDGFAMLEKLRAHPWGRKAKVVILSSLDDVKSIASAHTDKITDYFIKSNFSLKELVNKVRLAVHAED